VPGLSKIFEYFNADELMEGTGGTARGVADNFRGETVTLVAGCLNFHHASLPKAS